MSAVSGIASAARVRILPHGPLDLLRQLAIWFGFLYAYRYTRGVADRDPFKAFHNGLARRRPRASLHRVVGALAPEPRRVFGRASRG